MKRLIKWFSLPLCMVLILQFVACGTILYPERKGQMNGRIDPSVALLDAVGLLFFLIPGIIAFAVDFSNGTIYLPGGGRSQLSAEELSSLSDKDTGKIKLASVNQMIREKTKSAVVMTETNTAIFPAQIQ